MLEMCVNQGAGLREIAMQAAPRVMAVASHGDQQGELPLLWSLCSTMVEFGYPVAVLDATTIETTDNPGLAQLLDDAYWPGDLNSDALSWTVIPAALGLQQLGILKFGHGKIPLDSLSGFFQSFGVVIIYARADILSRVLTDSGIEPLLAVSPARMSPVTAYQALKQMLLDAQLRPTIAALMQENSSKLTTANHTPIENLQKCAMTFLGYRLDSLVIRAVQPQDRPSDDMHRLALRLLENAMPLHSNHFLGSR
jgi:hypothetical protein